VTPLNPHMINENDTDMGGCLRCANVTSPLAICIYMLDLFGTNHVTCDSGGGQHV